MDILSSDREDNVRLRFAFVGFRHFHIYELYNLVAEHPECEITSVVEENPHARAEMVNRGGESDARIGR